MEKFKKKWNKKKYKKVYDYCTSWFSGKFSKWQIWHNPPGWANTNSNIESFNATIKRDFSLRKRYSVYSSVNVIKQIISYYSTNKNQFHLTPKFDAKLHQLGLKCAITNSYKRREIGLVVCNDKYVIKIKKRTCNCRYFLKNGVCSHILGFLYKTPSYNSEHWFGSKYNGDPTSFAFNVKRGAKKKTVGCYKRSEKALSSY